MATLLYIVRHAFAGQHGDPRYPDDALRPLTKKGTRQFRRMVKKLARRDFAPELVATSPLVRCRQTADVIADRVETEPDVVERDELQPGGSLDALIRWSAQQPAQQLAWVGHAPDVDEMASALLGDHGADIVFAKGAIAAISFDDQIATGKGQLRWLVTPRILGA
jgi:phosphohistidine phosphatase